MKSVVACIAFLFVFVIGGGWPVKSGRAKTLGEHLDLVMPPPGTAAQNAAALSRFFGIRGAAVLNIPSGTYLLPCGNRYAAEGSFSIVGAGAGRTVLRFEKPCTLTTPVMAWTSKSNVRLSGFTLDLNRSRSATLQNIVQFEAYQGDAEGLQISHIAVINGNTPSLQIAVAASGGFTYSGVVIDGNRLEMRPGQSQNQCIALTTVNGRGYIPSARITNNVCNGSGIQIDGVGTLVEANDVSRYQFGTGIFAAFVHRTDQAAAPKPSSRNCIIRKNVLHDTPQTLDVNRAAPGGIENNCVDALIENNEAFNLGGAGFVNYGNRAKYIRNRARGVGFAGHGSAGGEGDNAAFAISESSSEMPWYRSIGLVFENNSSEARESRPSFGYYEEPWHLFGATLRGNSFGAAKQSQMIRSPSCRAAPVKC